MFFPWQTKKCARKYIVSSKLYLKQISSDRVMRFFPLYQNTNQQLHPAESTLDCNSDRQQNKQIEKQEIA